MSSKSVLSSNSKYQTTVPYQVTLLCQVTPPCLVTIPSQVHRVSITSSNSVLWAVLPPVLPGLSQAPIAPSTCSTEFPEKLLFIRFCPGADCWHSYSLCAFSPLLFVWQYSLRYWHLVQVLLIYIQIPLLPLIYSIIPLNTNLSHLHRAKFMYKI
jgi:hypothetical protein